MKRTLYQVFRARYRYLYTAALAITGNELTAEEVLLDAIAEAGERASFARALRLLTRRALANAGEDDGVEFLAESPAAAETDEVRRALLLKYGLRLSTRAVAQALGINIQDARDMLARVQKTAPLVKACEIELKKGYRAPDAATFKQMLENRCTEREETAAGRTSGLWRVLAGGVLVLLIGFMVWLSAVLLDYYITSSNETETVTEAVYADN